MLAIYTPGSMSIHGTIHNNMVDYTELTVDEYLAQNPGAMVTTLDNACEQIEYMQNKNLLGPWSEITREEWWEAIEVLPPEKWERIGAFEVFRCMEYYTSNITAHYICNGDKYYHAKRRTSTPYSEMITEILALSPQYQHDCDSCIFLGQYEGYDLYSCGRTLIARYGDDGPDYTSADDDILTSSTSTTPATLVLKKAMELRDKN